MTNLLPTDVMPSRANEAAAAAVRRAQVAHSRWREVPLRTRTARMRLLRRALIDRMDDIVETVHNEIGKPRAECVVHEITLTAALLRFLENEGERTLARKRVSTWPLVHKTGEKWYEPYGVVGVIAPANFPFLLTALPTLSALMAGNTVVLKPSERAPRSARLLASLVREAIPEHRDLLMLLEGGAAEGESLVKAGVDKLVFLGGIDAGRHVAALAAEHLTPLVLELGANDVAVVCDDADLERAAAGTVWAATANTGQICMSLRRALVQASVYERFLKLATAEMRRIRAPDDIGALLAGGRLQPIEELVADARECGARILIGGSPVSQVPPIYPPTLIVDAREECALHSREIFGPVLAVTSVADDAEAARIARLSPYGLNASIWSRDAARARTLAERLRCGAVVINDVMTNMGLPLPYGGTALSGYGRLLGTEGLLEFVRTKSVVGSRLTLAREPYWYPYTESRYRQLHRLVRATFAVGLGRRIRAIVGR